MLDISKHTNMKQDFVLLCKYVIWYKMSMHLPKRHAPTAIRQQFAMHFYSIYIIYFYQHICVYIMIFPLIFKWNSSIQRTRSGIRNRIFGCICVRDTGVVFWNSTLEFVSQMSRVCVIEHFSQEDLFPLTCSQICLMGLKLRLIAGHDSVSIAFWCKWTSTPQVQWDRALSCMTTGRLASVWLSKWEISQSKIVYYYLWSIRVPCTFVRSSSCVR